MANLRESSRLDWTSKQTTEDINAGSLQRIADAGERTAAACELLAQDRQDILRSLEFWEQAAKDAQAERDALDRSNRSLRGVITRLRKAVKR